MSNNDLMDVLSDVEFCDLNTGRYYRAVSVVDESTGVVVMLVGAGEGGEGGVDDGT